MLTSEQIDRRIDYHCHDIAEDVRQLCVANGAGYVGEGLLPWREYVAGMADHLIALRTAQAAQEG